MRITLSNGDVLEIQFSPDACVGYSAQSIELAADDCMMMARLASSDPNEFQATMRQLASRLPGGRAGNNLVDQIRLEMTCIACPEQYDAFLGDKQVAYLRLRHGVFSVDCPDVGGETVLRAYPQGDGSFDDDEREHFLQMAKEAIAHHIATTEENKPATPEV